MSHALVAGFEPYVSLTLTTVPALSTLKMSAKPWIFVRQNRNVRPTRTALAAALAEMIAAHEISDRQALTMARGYLHDNAAALYR